MTERRHDEGGLLLFARYTPLNLHFTDRGSAKLALVSFVFLMACLSTVRFVAYLICLDRC
jgi:hypothetical protein